MIEFDNSDGSMVIEFPQGAVRVKAPTFGGFKRLRAERVRLARVAQDQLTAWEAEHPVPEGDDVDPVEIARHAEDRILAVEAANLTATEAWWRLLLVGDDTFKGLAETPVPEDVDDWPPSLLVDIRPAIPAGSSVEVILSAQSMPDQWMRHVGLGRSRSGPMNGAAINS